MFEKLTRREVVKTILVTSATSLIGNKAWAAKLVGDVKPKASFDEFVGTARVLLSSFPALGNDGGSVRLGSSTVRRTTDSDGSPHYAPDGLFYPILINRVSATEYLAIDSQCLHSGCVLPTASAPVNGVPGKIKCLCHGSEYTFQGICTAGPAPVGQSLRIFPSTLESSGILRIETDQWFDMAQTIVLNASEKRLQITWDSFEFVEYELRWRPDLTTEPVKINFATTPSGAMNTAVIMGNDNAATDPGAVKIYVVPQDGIYQVAIRLRSL
jgi:Rieske Fe-S protein